LKKKKIYRNPDIAKYIIVKTKEGDVLRAKRKDPFINEALKEMAAETCSGAARQILTRLQPFTEKMSGRMNVRISGKMRSAKKRNGAYDYSLMQDFELQKDYPLHSLYNGIYKVRKQKQAVHIDVPVSTEYIKAKNTLVTQYYFEVVALYGHAMVAGDLRVEDERSQLFDFTKKYKTMLQFSFTVPEDTPYLLWLKVGCMEGKQEAHHPMHYGMKVAAVG
jgi:hypothetical protein